MSYAILPPLRDYESKGARRIQQLAEELDAKRQDVGKLETEIGDARRTLEEAKARDTEERARAERRGEKAPGKVHEEKARSVLSEKQDLLEVMRRVEQLIEADLTEAIAKHRGEILEEARTKRDEAAKAYTKAYRELRRLHDEQRTHAGAAAWAYAPSSHFSPAPPNMGVLSTPDTLPDDDPEKPAETISTENAGGLLRGA